MTTIINGSSPSITFSDGSAQTSATRPFLNRLINGNFVIDQRNAGASVTPNGSYTLDRWQGQNSQTSKYTVQQNAGSVTPPVGFTNYLGVTSSSAYSVASGDYFFLAQTIEGYNIADLGWGTANAKTITVSFWVRSSLTGTFGGAIRAGGFDQSYPFTYTINSANTWEYETITITGATSGTFGSTNGNGLQLCIGLGAGSTFSGTAGAWSGSNLVSATGATSVVGTNGATFYITGVQLEVGSTATSFDYRPYGTELALCQRYYLKLKGTAQFDTFGAGYCESTTTLNAYTAFPVIMRTSPTALEQSGTAADYLLRVTGTGPTCSAVPTLTSACPFSATSTFTVASGLTAGQAGFIRANNSTAFLAWSAEL